MALPTSERQTILVVTDTPEDLEVLQQQLGGQGYRLVQTWGTEKALESVESEEPDLVLLDVTSAGSEAVAFCDEIRGRAETEAIPVIIIADEAGTRQVETVLDIGADGYICRPFEEAELVSRVRSLLRGKQLHDRVAEQNRQLLRANTELDRLNQELIARNRELEQGMAMAHRLQEALLPQQYPRVKNVSFAHKYVPAEAIGGDIFQLIGLPDDRVALFISDVSGHGVRAALITSIVKAVVGYIDFSDKTPRDVLKDFNSRFRSILGPLTPQIYATAVVMIVDGGSRSLTVAAAGHPAPLLVSKSRMSAEPVISLEEVGPALGFLSDPEYFDCERQLAVGDIIFSFTDGIYEVADAQGNMFGLARLQKLVADNAHLIPRDLIQRIITETEDFMGTARRPDDLCVVTVEVH